MITTVLPKFFYGPHAEVKSKYALLTANEVVMMLPEFKTVLVDLQEKWQLANLNQ